MQPMRQVIDEVNQGELPAAEPGAPRDDHQRRSCPHPPLAAIHPFLTDGTRRLFWANVSPPYG
jgi:hypothetical protein